MEKEESTDMPEGTHASGHTFKPRECRDVEERTEFKESEGDSALKATCQQWVHADTLPEHRGLSQKEYVIAQTFWREIAGRSKWS
ncbi:hypothetical protein WR25_05772 [Diploscapter pachys]|uniref:Uncharacterized protein n=1 Tax=Diploscapter pachys TaxID=2018661 RepID=A0A2A2M101_9BILA|nr:hypothetical protein WR25_05772 [Diploscapter pachys]